MKLYRWRKKENPESGGTEYLEFEFSEQTLKKCIVAC